MPTRNNFSLPTYFSRSAPEVKQAPLDTAYEAGADNQELNISVTQLVLRWFGWFKFNRIKTSRKKAQKSVSKIKKSPQKFHKKKAQKPRYRDINIQN